MAAGAALLLLLGIVGCCRGLALTEECSGSDVTLTAAASARPLQIYWFRNNSQIVEVKKGRKPFYYILQDRVIVDLVPRTFILRNVTPGDSGTYRAAALVEGTLENTDFRLQVYVAHAVHMTETFDNVKQLLNSVEYKKYSRHLCGDWKVVALLMGLQQGSTKYTCFLYLCNVIISDITVQNKVKLQCVLSSPGAVPSNCKWYKRDSGNDYLVSDDCSITVQKEEETQLYKCVTRNGQSKYSATFTVPIREPDPVCNVTIHNITVENNVTLLCVCSSPGVAPSEYEWYRWDSGNDSLVSDEWSIAVRKEEKTQLYQCVARYKVSNNSATFIVPSKEPEPLRRPHTGSYVLLAILVLAFIMVLIVITIVTILLLKKTNKDQRSHRTGPLQSGPGAESRVLLQTLPPQSPIEEHPGTADEPPAQFSPEPEASPALVAPLPQPVVEDPAHGILESRPVTSKCAASQQQERPRE